jgi:hypothetical protein
MSGKVIWARLIMKNFPHFPLFSFQENNNGSGNLLEDAWIDFQSHAVSTG